MSDAPDPSRPDRTAAIVLSSEDAIIDADLNGIIRDWNPSAARLFGYSADEAIGRHISLLSLAGREAEMDPYFQQIAGGERIAHFEASRRHRGGSVVDISLSVSPIHDHQGRVVGVSIIARDIAQKRGAEEQTRMLLHELNHRAKNVLAVAQAMLRLTTADRIEDFRAALEGRIRTLARVHTLVADNNWDGAELGVLVQSGAESFHSHIDRIRRNGPTVWLSPQAAQVIGIVLHELTSNAARHGSLTAADGSVVIDWRMDEAGHVVLAWGEHGGPRVDKPSRRGFGTQVISQSVSDQLGGTSDLRWLEGGLECEFTLPSSHIRKPPRRLAAH